MFQTDSQYSGARALPPALSKLTAGAKFPEPPGAIAELGRRLNVMTEEHNRLDEQCVNAAWDASERDAIQAEMDALEDEAGELREQVLEMPARTLADCAVQASVIGEFADLWHSSIIDEQALNVDLAAIRRAAASIVAALVELGHLDIDRLASGDLRTCCDREMTP
jgi:hypothetical protein